MPGIKELKTRIKSIQSTRKITRAMQMVSAAKMRKAQTAVLQSRTYAELAWELVRSVQGAIPENPNASEGSFGTNSQANEMARLLDSHPNAKKIGVVLLTTNGGMVGSLNTNLINKVKKINGDESNKSDMPNREDKPHEINISYQVEFITYGRKGTQAMGRMGMKIMADFQKQDRSISSQDIYPIAKMIADTYATGEYQKIFIAYNHFVSTLSQKPTLKQLLPFAVAESAPLSTTPLSLSPIFEPSPKTVLEHLLPRIIESQIYETILESNASEHSARMVMMKNATESAGDLIADYTLTYNQLRQNKITTELAEITAGKIALE